jgi:tryptophan-rich sensory protein
LFVRNMRLFWTVFLIVIALAWTLIWLCASISVYESDFSELKNFEIIFFLLMMVGLAASRFSDAG